VNGAEVELVDESSQGLRRGGASAVLRRVAGVSEPGQIDGDHAVLGGQERDQLVKRPPGLGEPVHEQNRSAVRPGADVVQVGVVEEGVVVGDLGDRGAGRDAGHACSFR